MTNEWIGRYRIVRPLGEGGMGRVLLAEVAGAGGFARRVVLKLVRDELDEGLKQALLDEAKLTATLVHRNIVPVLDLQETGAQRLVVMEHVDGMDLQRLLARVGRVPWPLALFIASEVAAGLDYAHRRVDSAGRPLHIVHRDVSPANILVSWEGEVKLADFGIAKVARVEGLKGPWVTAGLKGNLGYMAPEQAAGGVLDPRADLYALGVVLYELLSGDNPWRGGVRRPAERAPLMALPAEVAPPEVAALVRSATAALPDQRPESAARLREALLHVPGLPKDPARQLASFLGPLRPRQGLDGEALVAAALGDKPATRVVGRAGAGAKAGAGAAEAGTETSWLRRWWPLPALSLAAALALGMTIAAARRAARPVRPAVVEAAAPATTGTAGADAAGTANAAAAANVAAAKAPSTNAQEAKTPAAKAPAASSSSQRIRADRGSHRRAVRKGSLSVNAIPWAHIFIDGAAVGHTPRQRLPLEAGRHQLRLVTEGGQARTRTVEILPGRDSRVTVTFAEP